MPNSTSKAAAADHTGAWVPSHLPSTDRTSQTDDERIKDITVLPPPEHLIRFFPIRGTPVEKLIGKTRRAIHQIMAGSDDRLLVVIGPCSIHDPAAALDYARHLKPLRDKHAGELENSYDTLFQNFPKYHFSRALKYSTGVNLQ
uniref:3-deoxy-7-phosphoheptulonate synthase n=1 Tax=uncultured bacterium A1Q1_fos_1050 TaxID=1256538 RepID=L7VUK6_9BACT|nr:2-keto-3-deoxy-D-arabino-heptulosonate-7- phosphate synthase I alpha [uncultured bacterium A1Q1_fos_1050]